MFIAALFTTAKTWKQFKCPLIEEWIKKMWYMYTMENYSAIRNKIMPFVAIHDLDRDDHTKSDRRDKYFMISFICRIRF